jgi:hypothetical protein
MFRATFLLAFLALIFVVTVSACFALLQHLQRPMAHRPAINAPLIVNLARHDAGAKPNPAPAAPPKPDAPKPAARPEPLVVNRWPLPSGQPLPDEKRGIRLAIQPSGPWVITQAPAAIVGYNPRTRQSRSMSMIEPDVSLHNMTINGRWFVQIRNCKSNKPLLNLEEAPTRDVCLTPDWERLIVVGRPATYPAYQVINLQGGYTVPEHAFKNVRLFDVATQARLAEFGPKDHGLDDDIYAVAPAPHGRTFFLATSRELLELSFATAFGLEPIAQ